MGEIQTAMEYTTRNSRRVKKVKEETVQSQPNNADSQRMETNSNQTVTANNNTIKTFLETNFNSNVISSKCSQSHYDLRNGKTFIIQPSSKLADEQNTQKCPPLVTKTKEPNCENYFSRSSGARPLGKKGHLSSKYNKRLRTSYIKQLFCEKEKIGEGSFGSVHAYYCYEDEKTYAIKIIQGKYKQAEITHLDAVDGLAYCIQYYNAWQENNLVYIQMELGVMSLADYAQKNHNISEEECWNILHDITNAMMCLHGNNYVHMDIKPENIVITPEGKYKLCDFGLMCDLNQKKSLRTFCEGDAKYLASEVLQDVITPAVDIFSLGISVLEIAMDLLLPTYGDLWLEIRNCDWRTLAKGEKRRISIEMEQLLNWMMCSQPEQRPSAVQLLGVPAIRMRSRSKKTRFNYFNDWYQKYLAQKEGELVPTIVVNHDNTFDCSTDFDLDIENDNIKTPPRRISSILICQRSK